MSTRLAQAGAVIPVAEILIPDNFAALLVEPRIKRLARSIQAVTQIAPVVLEPRGRSYKLWAGHDRLAAVRVAGFKEIRADIREGTEADFLLLQLAENEQRRHRAELESKLYDAVSEDTSTNCPSPRVREEIARAKGIKPGSQERTERRRRARDEEPEEAPAPRRRSDAEEALQLPPSFEMFGAELPAARRAAILGDMDDLSTWHRQVAEMEECLRLWEGRSEPVVRKIQVDGIRSAARALITALTNARPVGLCGWCKGARCEKCGQTGIAGRFDNEHVPAAVMLKAPPKELRRRQVQVEMPDGDMLKFDDEGKVAS